MLVYVRALQMLIQEKAESLREEAEMLEQLPPEQLPPEQLPPKQLPPEQLPPEQLPKSLREPNRDSTW